MLILATDLIEVPDLLHLYASFTMTDPANDRGGGRELEHKLVLCLTNLQPILCFGLPEVQSDKPPEVCRRVIHLCPQLGAQFLGQLRDTFQADLLLYLYAAFLFKESSCQVVR